MSEYKILPSQVLIVPGYTNEEILAMSAKTKNSSASALKNATSSTDKTAKNNDNKKTTSSSDKTSSTSSSSQTKSRMLKSRKAATKVNEAQLAKSKEKLKQNANTWNALKSWWNGITSTSYKTGKGYSPLRTVKPTKSDKRANPWKNIDIKKSTTTTTIKNKKQSTTKSTSKTKTTKKTSKASKKKKTTSKTSSSSSSSSKSKNKSNVNESSAATATETQVKVEKPKALLFSPNSVDYTPHRKDYEEFNSADGLILIEKACDQFAELQLSLSVHQAMRIQENGTIELSSDDKRPIDIITSGAPTILDPQTELGHFIDPADFTDSYIEIRRGFFDKYIGRPLTLVSDLFPTIAVCYITDISYNINEGEEQAEYSITFREVDNTWG